MGRSARTFALTIAAAAMSAAACRDVQRFSTAGDHFEGSVVRGDFVRAGVGGDVRLCLTLDTDHLQDAAGTITSSDGRFAKTPLRPIPQIWHDPLSTLDFGQGRIKNMMYMAAPVEDGGAADVTVVVSLMQAGGVEVRMLRGAPGAPDAATPSGGNPSGRSPASLDGVQEGPRARSAESNLFAVFALERAAGPCPF